MRRRLGGLPLGSFAAWKLSLKLIPVGAPVRLVVNLWLIFGRGAVPGRAPAACGHSAGIAHSARVNRTDRVTGLRFDAS